MRCGGIFDVDTREKKLAELEQFAAAPDFWSDQNTAKSIIDRTNQQRIVLKPFAKLCSSIEDADVLMELLEGETDKSQVASVVGEVEHALNCAEKVFEELELKSLLSGELDGNNAYVSLHAGAGGTESCDWADMLLRMYRRFCEENGFEAEIMELQAGEEAGIKSCTFLVSGPFAYGYMKAERGVHRLVRISPFDSNKRRHTSFAALDVVAEIADDVDVDIDEQDLRVDTYRSGGAGGQHVNTTDSAVRLTHLPTGIVVACQAERSQHKNKAKAMKVLRARVYEWRLDQKRKDMEKFYGAKGEIAWGSQIRSYVLQPYTMVKDHRTGVETSNVNRVLDGCIKEFIEGYLKKSVKG
ncbi:MAG: peptide chain release factor 2 [Kiritimatiellae bacterium]|nr:peptide chain release factor 2 [Kiritimatiellia bacterium]